jgi:hypothetical protein
MMMPKDSDVNQESSRGFGRRLFWAATLIAASVAFSLGFACAVPLAGFAAFAALTAGRSEALLLVLVVFLANQCVGFGLLHYPHTAETFIWGGVLGVVALAATWAALWTRDHLRTGRLTTMASAFLVAFVVYEGLLFAATAISGEGFEAYAGPVVARIFAINAAAFVGLLALHRIAAAVGFVDLAAGTATRGSAPT